MIGGKDSKIVEKRATLFYMQPEKYFIIFNGIGIGWIFKSFD